MISVTDILGEQRVAINPVFIAHITGPNTMGHFTITMSTQAWYRVSGDDAARAERETRRWQSHFGFEVTE